MKDKPIKQPWPRSAKITVWVLGVVVFLLGTYVVLDAYYHDYNPACVPPIVY